MSEPNNNDPSETLATRAREPVPTLASLGTAQAELDALLGWLQKMPHDLVTAARAAGMNPADALTWYLYGQWPGCPVPELVAFAANIAQQRAELAAKNYERTVQAADAGDLRAIERLDNIAASSPLSGYPGRSVAEEIAALVRQGVHADLTRVQSEYEALPAAPPALKP
jgi:hypothetical protein